jgi:hypothetical protein
MHVRLWSTSGVGVSVCRCGLVWFGAGNVTVCEFSVRLVYMSARDSDMRYPSGLGEYLQFTMSWAPLPASASIAAVPSASASASSSASPRASIAAAAAAAAAPTGHIEVILHDYKVVNATTGIVKPLVPASTTAASASANGMSTPSTRPPTAGTHRPMTASPFPRTPHTGRHNAGRKRAFVIDADGQFVGLSPNNPVLNPSNSWPSAGPLTSAAPGSASGVGRASMWDDNLPMQMQAVSRPATATASSAANSSPTAAAAAALGSSATAASIPAPAPSPSPPRAAVNVPQLSLPTSVHEDIKPPVPNSQLQAAAAAAASGSLPPAAGLQAQAALSPGGGGAPSPLPAAAAYESREERAIAMETCMCVEGVWLGAGPFHLPVLTSALALRHVLWCGVGVCVCCTCNSRVPQFLARNGECVFEHLNG